MPDAMRQGERKLATLLFADLSGYTDLTRRLDPEDVVSVVDPVMQDLQRIAEAHGGTVLMIAGDGLLCAFGVPHAREDDAVRAVRAAYDMRRAATAAPDTAGLHAGIASGEVLISSDASPRGWGITGLCVAMATRLADIANNGVILVDEECRRLVGDSVRWGPETEVQIQGMGQRPSLVAELEAVDEGPPPRPRGDFVDRMVHQARLDELLAQVTAEGESRVVSLRGEAGTGKTRLVDNWSESHPEVTVVKGRCRSYGDERPLAGLLDALLRQVRILGLHDLTGLSSLFPWLAVDEASAIAARLLSSSTIGGAPPPADDIGLALARAVRELLVALSATAPLVVIVDDAQWAGADLESLLRQLSTTPLEASVMVVAIQREGEAWGELPPLDPLPNWAGKQLVLSRLGSASDELVHSLVARTGGNPLYLEESLNLLQDGVDQSALLTSLPTSVRALLAARLDSLPPSAKEVALVASAGADVTSREALSALVEGDGVESALELLVARGVLIEVVDDGYRFAHKLFQEAAYAALTRRRRVELHLAALDRLTTENPALRAFHAEAAWRHLNTGSAERCTVARRALQELRTLGELVFSWQAAAAHAVFQRAEPIAADVEEEAPGHVAEFLAGHAQVLIDLGHLEEARARSSRAIDLCSRSVAAEGAHRWEAKARLALGHALARLGDMAGARSELSRVLELAAELGDRGLRGHALKVLAESWRFESESRFRELLEDSYQELGAAGDDRGQAQVARLLAYVLSMSGSPDFRRWYAVALAAQSLDDLRGRAMIARIGGYFASGRADWLEAKDVAAEALEWGTRAGLADVVTDARLVAVTASTFLGDPGTALEHREVLMDRMEGLPPRARLALAGASALALLRAGRAGDAQRELELAASLITDFGEPELLLERQSLAEVALDAGRWDVATAATQHAIRLAGGQGLLGVQLGIIACRSALASARDCQPEIQELMTTAAALGALPLLVQAQVVAVQAAPAATLAVPSLPLPDGHFIEARAIWFENAAMRATDDDEARDNWQRAHDEWARLGHTIWPQRALKAKESVPRSIKELAAIPLTPLLEDLTTTPSDA